MAWARLDDGFSEHEKTLQLTGWGTELGIVIAALCYTGRRGNPRIPREALRILGAKPRDAARLVQIGLWDEVDGGWEIHDWHQYQGPKSNAERQAGWRRRNGNSNGDVTNE